LPFRFHELNKYEEVMRPTRSSFLYLSCSLIVLLSSTFASGQEPAVQPRITQAIDESSLSVLHHNTHPLARAQFDQGVAPPSLPMEHMLLVLKRSYEQETALRQLLDQQQDKLSSNYHKWLTPEEFGKRFGPADQDLQSVTSWLQSHGFQVAQVNKGRGVIEFSGTAATVQESFHTVIHKYVVNGESHWANASDPSIPTALSPVVAGVWSLHNFLKQPTVYPQESRFEALATLGAKPKFTGGSGVHALAPADYYKIYNIPTPNGTAGSIGIVGRSNINPQDVSNFHQWMFDGAQQPQIIVNGADPGDLGGGEELEAVLDTTWSGAVSPSSPVYLVVSASTNTSDGVDLSELYIIDNNLTDVMSESFGGCEAFATGAAAAAVSSLAQQAAAQGISYFVSTGDSGSAGCDDPNFEQQATNPPSVNLLASTPYTVAVGGTMFNEGTNSSAYWATTNSNPSLESALSYIPENVWNESCSGAKCGTAKPSIWAGGGGVSQYFQKPSWQSGVSGIPADGLRDLPDVSLTAAGHDPYLLCLQGSCIPDSQGRIFFVGVGGTSASSPAFAGIMALVDGNTGSRQGQANYVLYRLAASENLAQCNGSSTSGLPASSCIFNDVTSGTNSVPGESGYGTPTAQYPSTKGYDLATGLGSVNVGNLIAQWNTVSFRPTVTTFSVNPQTAVHGSSFNVTMSVAPATGTGVPSGYAWLQGGTPRSNLIGDSTVATYPLDASGTVSTTTHILPGGTYTANAHYAGDGTFAPSDSTPPVTITVQPEPSTTTVGVFTSDLGGNLTPFSSGTYGTPLVMKAHVAGQSGYGSPTSYVSFSDNVAGGIIWANVGNNGDAVSAPFAQLALGPHAISGGYQGDASFKSSASAPVNITLTQATTTTTVTSQALAQGASFTATVNTNSYAAPPTGTMTFYSGSTSLGSSPVTGGVGANGTISAWVVFDGSQFANGQYSITATYSGDTNYGGSTSPALNVNLQPDFSVGLSSPTLTVSRGQAGVLTLGIASFDGFTGTINFTSASCSGLPAESSCTFFPASVIGSGATSLSVSTTGPHTLVQHTPPVSWLHGATAVAGCFVGVLFFGLTLNRRTLRPALLLILFALLFAGLGCSGGGGSSGGTHQTDPGTPAGSYVITVSAVSGSTTHATTFTLQVQ
jgi:hypothetical protein